MFSISSIKGKFKRSGINFKKTFLYNEKPLSNEEALNLFESNEKCIIYYKKSNDYSWYLTDKRFIILNEKKIISLNDLKKIDIPNIKDNPSQKKGNTELTLFTTTDKIIFFVEEESWHLFYNIFKFIIGNNPSSAKCSHETPSCAKSPDFEL